MNYFKDADAGNLGFAAFPNMNPKLPYPIYSIGSAFTYSINTNSQVEDGAAMVLDMMMSKKFAMDIAKVWPGYWSIPLNDFPTDPPATGKTKSYYDAMADITAAVKQGHFGYKIGTGTLLTMLWLRRRRFSNYGERASHAACRSLRSEVEPDLPRPKRNRIFDGLF